MALHVTIGRLRRPIAGERPAVRRQHATIKNLVLSHRGVQFMVSTDRTNEIEHFNRWSRTYDKSWIQRYADRLHVEMLHIVASSTGAPNTILDVGCGTGQLLLKAHALYPSAQVIGIDPAEGMVAFARSRVPSATIHLAPAESLPLADSSVDVVFSSLSFHHWNDQRAAVREICRVLLPGGSFCLTDISLPEWLTKFILRINLKSPAATSRLFEDAGLSVKVQHRTSTRWIMLTLGAKESKVV